MLGRCAGAKTKGEIDLSTIEDVVFSQANSEISSGMAFELRSPQRYWGLAATADGDMAWYGRLADHVKALASQRGVAERPTEGLDGELQGWLWKRGKLNSTWKRRYCVLSAADKTLRYFKKKGSKRAQGSIDVRSASYVGPCRDEAVQAGAVTRDAGGIAIVAAGQRLAVFEVVMGSRTYWLACATPQAMRAWTQRMRRF